MHNAAVCGIADSVDMHAVLRGREKMDHEHEKKALRFGAVRLSGRLWRALGACADVPGLLKSL